MTDSSPVPDVNLIRQAWSCRCPRCGIGSLYREGFLNINLNESCSSCGLKLSKSDSADGPAVFLIFILGFLLVPAALLLEWAVSPPLWLHVIVWGIVALGLTLGSLRPIKAYIIALQFKHRPESWE